MSFVTTGGTAAQRHEDGLLHAGDQDAAQADRRDATIPTILAGPTVQRWMRAAGTVCLRLAHAARSGAIHGWGACRWGPAADLLALALALAVGGAVLHYLTAAGAAASSTPAAVVRPSVTEPATRPARTTAPAAPPREIVYYLVASPEQAEQVRDQLDEAERLWNPLGETPLIASIVVDNSAADDARVAEMLTAEYYLCLTSGLPPPRLVDLRTP